MCQLFDFQLFAKEITLNRMNFTMNFDNRLNGDR